MSDLLDFPDLSTDETQWLTTEQNPNVPQYGVDQGQRGWRVHAVPARRDEKFPDVADRPAACGLRARHGWGMDMFVDRPCARCLVKLGLACSVCRGRGHVGKVREGTHQLCFGCVGKCTKKAQDAHTALKARLAAAKPADPPKVWNRWAGRPL